MVAKVFPIRSQVGPIRDTDEGNGHKGSRNQRRGAACDSPRERQPQFAIAEAHSRVMAPNALTRMTAPWPERLSPSSRL
jgi:hypothetical protein